MPTLDEPIVLATTITEYIVFLILTWVNILLFRRYRERKSTITKQLLLAFIFFSLAPFFQPFDLFIFDKWTTENWGYIASPGYSAAMMTGAIGNYFLVHFSVSTFKEDVGNYPKIIGLLNILVALLFSTFKVLDYEMIAFIFQVMHIVISFIIYFQLAFFSFKGSQRMHENGERDATIGFFFIGLCGIFLALMYVFFVLESFIFNTYSYLSVIGWIFSVGAGFSAYIGFTMPHWLRKSN
jgi:hypothetical protein